VWQRYRHLLIPPRCDHCRTTATHCNTLQHSTPSTQHNTLQHTAIHTLGVCTIFSRCALIMSASANAWLLHILRNLCKFPRHVAVCSSFVCLYIHIVLCVFLKVRSNHKSTDAAATTTRYNKLQHTAAHSNTQHHTAEHLGNLYNFLTLCGNNVCIWICIIFSRCAMIMHLPTPPPPLQHNKILKNTSHSNTLQHTATHLGNLHHFLTMWGGTVGIHPRRRHHHNTTRH